MTKPILCMLDDYAEKIDYPNHERTTDDCRFVYLFRNELTNLYKIGITDAPRKRMKQLQTASGMYLQDLIILQCEVGIDEAPIIIEKYLHNYFKNKRVVGEWFELNVKEVIAIQRLFWQIFGEMIWDNIKYYNQLSKQLKTEK